VGREFWGYDRWVRKEFWGYDRWVRREFWGYDRWVRREYCRSFPLLLRSVEKKYR
jgi:hypothetical protein